MVNHAAPPNWPMQRPAHATQEPATLARTTWRPETQRRPVPMTPMQKGVFNRRGISIVAPMSTQTHITPLAAPQARGGLLGLLLLSRL